LLLLEWKFWFQKLVVVAVFIALNVDIFLGVNGVVVDGFVKCCRRFLGSGVFLGRLLKSESHF